MSSELTEADVGALTVAKLKSSWIREASRTKRKIESDLGGGIETFIVVRI